MILSYAFLKTILKDHCPTSEDLEHKLTHIGFEVDSVDRPPNQQARVVSVASITPFTWNDKALFSVTVTENSKDYSVVTSWDGLKPGDKVVYAAPGAMIADKVLQLKTFDNYQSEGMLLSWKELNLNSDSLTSIEKNGLLVLPEDTPVGEDFHELFFLNEPFFHLKIPYNRPDCLSFLGLLREILTAYRITLSVQARKDIRILLPTFNERQLHRSVHNASFKGIELEDKEKCPYYAGSIIENVQIALSGYEIRRRLFAFQIKPIFNAVDAVNLLMMYFGHPLHTFDLDKITGKHVIIRSAKNGESIETLDDRTISLDENDLVIADEIRPIAIAGIIGGKDTEVAQDTKNIFIESAWFNPIAITNTSERHRFQTDASSRFSRGTDICQVKDMMMYASHMISILCNGTISGENYQQGNNESPSREIPYSLSDFSRITGFDVSKYSATQILQCLEIPFDIKLQDQLLIKVPSFRMNDLKESVDITEDLLRFIGYDKIKPIQPRFNITYSPENPRIKTEQWIRPIMMGQGFDEIITDSFVADEVLSLAFSLEDDSLIKVANPLRSGWQFLTPDKLLNMMPVIKNNFSRKINDLRLFEIGKHYGKDLEDLYLSLVMTGPKEKKHWLESNESYDFYYIKGMLEALFRRLKMPVEQKKNLNQKIFDKDLAVDYFLNNYPIASAGKVQKAITDYFDISQDVFYARCKFATIIKYFNHEPRYETISYMQEISRDICLLVPREVRAGDMIQRIENLGDSALKSVSIFDLYEGSMANAPEHHKSIAFRLQLIFRTNVSKEKIQELIDRVVDDLALNFQAILRK